MRFASSFTNRSIAQNDQLKMRKAPISKRVVYNNGCLVCREEIGKWRIIIGDTGMTMRSNNCDGE
jgi:hypothetical protein